VEFEIHGAKHKLRIESIDAFKSAATPASPEQAAATPQA
jgi:hypothetical protein